MSRYKLKALDGRVLEPQEWAVVVLAAESPPSDLGEGDRFADPLPLPGWRVALACREDAAVGYQRVIGTARNYLLTGFQLGLQEAAPLNSDPIAALVEVTPKPSTTGSSVRVFRIRRRLLFHRYRA